MSEPPIARFDRRAFLRTAALGAGALATGSVLAGCDTETPTHSHGMLDPSFARPGRGPTTRNALRIPQTVSPNGLTLTAQPGVADLGGGRTAAAWLYNGQFPGPTILANVGSTADLRLNNGLSQDSITHWHGILAPAHADGHPHDAVAPGASFDYAAFTLSQRGGLYWYHPHPHGTTGEQVYRGLAGAFILRDPLEATLGLPIGLPYEVPLIIRDASFDSTGNFSFTAKSSGFLGNTPLVNGTLAPYLLVDAGIYRFRVLNGCNARVLKLALGNGAAFQLIGNDGGLLEQTVAVTEIEVAPGERLDVLVDLRQLATGASIMLRDNAAGWDLLELRGSGVIAPAGSIPTTLSSIASLGAAAATRSFSFDGMSRINGRTYDMNRLDFSVPFGQTELWRFRTNGNAPHPVHVHGVLFQVQARTGGRGQVFPWERGWKDTVLLNDGETVDVLVRFTAHTGLYVMHCHQLAHEDNGMMANFEVI